MSLTSDLKYPYVEYVYNQKPYGNQGYPRWIHEQFDAEIADLKQQLNEVRKDTERLDWLESFINENGALLLHNGSVDTKGHSGLGLRPGYCDRTLREAIDAARKD